MALSFHYLASEESIVAKLMEAGQGLLEKGEWKGAVEVLEEVENMDKWAEMHATEIYSSLALAYGSLGDVVKSKHYLQLYRDVTVDQQFGEEIPEDVESGDGRDYDDYLDYLTTYYDEKNAEKNKIRDASVEIVSKYE